MAFFTVPHVAQRINRFLDPASGDTFNVDLASDSFLQGGWFGRGPGEGTIKRILPEGHTDFVFAVAGEEFGVVLCLILVALFAFIVIRALVKAMRTDDPFIRFAAAGLAMLFGLQSTINMAVNLHLMPAKGMTLPFVSYGGSSLISLAYGMGMLVALTRERPRAKLGSAPARHDRRIRNSRIGGRGVMDAASPAPVLVAAGGTGGHLFPAEALTAALVKRGITTHLVTDKRAARFGGAFADETVHIVSSATFASRNPIAVTKTLAALARGFMEARRLIRQIKPAAVIGFGGYPTIPPVMAAVWRRVPSLIHDSNAVIGRANRLLAPRVTAIATTFPDMFADAPQLAAKATVTGNPLRPAVLAAAAVPYPAPADPLRILVTGGSQGARIMADIVPAAIGRLDPNLQARLAIVQQAREEDFEPRQPDLCAALGRRRDCAVLFRSAGAHGRLASRDLAFRRRHCRRACSHRPAVDPGAAAGRARSGPVRQCRRAGKRGRRAAAAPGRFHPAAPCQRNRGACRQAGAAHRHGGGGQIGRPPRRRRTARRPRPHSGGDHAEVIIIIISESYGWACRRRNCLSLIRGWIGLGLVPA